MFTDRTTSLFILLISLVTACMPATRLDIDKNRWISDHEGCSGYRLETYREIVDHKEKMLGLSNERIIRLLGPPNINELYKRNQKFFIYRISGGDFCDGSQSAPPLFLIFRFNATGLANEIYLNDKASPTE